MAGAARPPPVSRREPRQTEYGTIDDLQSSPPEQDVELHAKNAGRDTKKLGASRRAGIWKSTLVRRTSPVTGAV